MLGDGLLSFLLRVGELAFAAVVVGLTGEYLSVSNQPDSSWDKGRFIYTECVAALSIFLALLWLLPLSGSFIHWPVDFLLFVAWMVAFGLLVQYIGPLDCGSVFYWGDITQQGTCQKWKADVAFAFLSAIFWLVSAVLGLWVIHRARGVPAGATSRRRWYRSYRV